MSHPAARSVAFSPQRPDRGHLRVAFVGPRAWLDGCAPPERSPQLLARCFQSTGEGTPATLAALAHFGADVTVAFDPASLRAELIDGLTGVTLGILTGAIPAQPEPLEALARLDRLVSFDPALTGTAVGSAEIWRAVPPPVGDRFFGPVRALHSGPRAMSIGRSTAYRESMLMPAKHHHDVLQVIHGLSGETLGELMGEYDIGVHVGPDGPRGFGQQAGMHLAAGHLLMSTALTPAHGLEREIDYLQFDSPEALVWSLERLGRFPEMHQRVRVRGRLKAEQYRASGLFGRLLGDLLADVRVFGGARAV
jgi:hypothetical protein